MSSTKDKQAVKLKRAMRQLPFPVTIVTAADGEEKQGITVGSFTSLSLKPPLISSNIDREAQIHALLTGASYYAVHILLPEQSDLCNHFAISGLTAEERFEPVEYHRNTYGTPILEEASTVIQCRAYDQFEAGDHTILAGEVLEVEQQHLEPAILYYDRVYRSVGKTVTTFD
jgi:flavin reductase (DIM6/NTAB) family NADH-FMN oxidoreductase RutF